MDFRGQRQRPIFQGKLTDLPHDELAHLLALVVVQGGCLTASHLRRSCRFFGRLGGYEAMEAGCRAAVAECVGCTEESAQLHRQPADEQWMRTAAILFDRRRELHLLVLRFVEARREVQQLPCGATEYAERVNGLEADLAAMRQRHGAVLVATALIEADAREAQALLPAGFHLFTHGFLSVLSVYDGPHDSSQHGMAPTCRIHIPGMTGTLTDGARYEFDLWVSTNYPSKNRAQTFRHQLLKARCNDLFHPNVYLSGGVAFHGLLDAWSCWDASVSLTEVVLHLFASLHQMNINDPGCKEPYESARNDRPRFRRQVRDSAESWAPVGVVPDTPRALKMAALLPDPDGSRFRSFELEGHTLRLHWAASGKWPNFTWPGDVNANGQLVEPEPDHWGWL